MSVTWTCDPAIPADGFDEFGNQPPRPRGCPAGEEILFPAVQTYSSGEGSAGSTRIEADTPAPRLVVVSPRKEEAAAAPAAPTTTEAADESADETGGRQQSAPGR